MLLVGTVFICGVVAFSLAQRYLGFPRSAIGGWPALAVATLWEFLILPICLLGLGAMYAGRAISRRRGSHRRHRAERVTVVATDAVLFLGIGAVLLTTPFPRVRAVEIAIGLGLAAVLGHTLLSQGSRQGLVGAGVGVGGTLGLMLTGLAMAWVWTTPPVISRHLLGFSIASIVPRPLLVSTASDAHLILNLLPQIDPLSVLSLVASAIGSIVFLYVLSSMVGHVLYTAQRGIEKVEDLTLVLVTIASEDVREALMDAIEHNRQLFEDYDFRVVIDEGADLQSELEAMDIDLVVVPDEFDPDAIAKGRAMQYFIETHVSPDEWYAFFDDDNLIQGREFLYEIPKQEAAGNLVMNPILLPRPGGSVIAFAIDHMRTLFDFTFFRTFTGLLGRPYAGLHGELLCARGDVLLDVGFDRPTIVEDFAFADELIRRGIGTWQSQTTTSILSPHSLDGYFTQRTRWFIGKLRWFPNCGRGTMAVTGLILGIWMLGIFGGWLAGGIWFLFGPPIQTMYLGPAILSAGLYGGIYVVGLARAGTRHLPKVLLLPLYATIEHLAPYYALMKRSDSFEVIKK